DIDRPGAIEVFEPPAYLRPGPDVDRRHMRFSAVSSALRSHPVETLAVAAQQPEARPLAGVAQRQRLADSAGCAGDNDRPWQGQSNSMAPFPDVIGAARRFKGSFGMTGCPEGRV